MKKVNVDAEKVFLLIMLRFINILFDILTLYSVISLEYTLCTMYDYVPLHFMIFATFAILWLGAISIAVSQKKMLPFISKHHDVILKILKRYFFALSIAVVIYYTIDFTKLFPWKYEPKSVIAVMLEKAKSSTL